MNHQPNHCEDSLEKTRVSNPETTVSNPVSSLQNSHIQLEQCSRSDLRYKTIRDRHYIPNHGCIGQQVHFLIHYKGGLVGIISGASPVYATASRDGFFGIDKDNRRAVLNGIINNVVFRLETSEPHLATRVLRVWREIVPHVWYQKYGTIIYGFETFVVETDTRKGSLYKADNWTLVGRTQGVTKIRNGIEKPADDWDIVTPKLVYCRWRDGFCFPCSGSTPGWVRALPDTASVPKIDNEPNRWDRDKETRRKQREYFDSPNAPESEVRGETAQAVGS